MTTGTGAEPVHAGLRGLRRALAFGAFRRLWVAAVISRTGDALNVVALPLFVYASTRSAVAVAAVVVTEGAAMVAGAAAAQLVVDRLEPRAILVGADVARAGAALALVVAPGFPTALAVAAALALGASWFSPTSAALVPRLVDAASLPAANTLLWTAGVVLQLCAAPFGGFLVGAGLARLAFALNALSFVGSAAVLARLDGGHAPAPGGGVWRQLPEALRAVPVVPLLVPLLVTQVLAALAVGATSALLVVLAEGAYGLSGTGYGVWLAAIAVGALVGPLAVPAVVRLPPGGSVCGAYVVRGAGDVVLGTVGSAAAGGALLFTYGLCTSSGAVAYQTLVQQGVPERLRGRAFALLDLTWQSARLASIAAGGVVAGAVGVRPLFVGCGALLTLAGLQGALTLPAAARRPAHAHDGRSSAPPCRERWDTDRPPQVKDAHR